MNINEAVNKIERFLKERGIKIYRINVSTDDEGALIDIYTNLLSMKEATKIEEELWKLIPNEEISILVYPAD